MGTDTVSIYTLTADNNYFYDLFTENRHFCF